MYRMKVKAKDIAKELGISPATVSLVLNNKPGVGEETRQRVLNAVRQTGYYPTVLDKQMMNRNGNIKFVVYKKHGKVVSDTPFFSELIEGIDREARKGGYNFSITYVDEQQDDIAAMAKMIKNEEPDGILLLATEMNAEDLDIFKKLNIPLLLIDSCFEYEDIDSVVIHNSEGAYRAVRHIVDLGFLDIGYLHSSVAINNFEQRRLGFRKEMVEHGLRIPEDNIFLLEPTLEGAYRDMKSQIEKKKDIPQAIFADNDIIAIGAVRALKEAGYQIPGDVSVVGFDDMPMCEIMEPKLTTVKVYKQGMGRIAVKRLIEIIEEKPVEHLKIYVGTELVIRESTRHYKEID